MSHMWNGKLIFPTFAWNFDWFQEGHQLLETYSPKWPPKKEKLEQTIKGTHETVPWSTEIKHALLTANTKFIKVYHLVAFSYIIIYISLLYLIHPVNGTSNPSLFSSTHHQWRTKVRLDLASRWPKSVARTLLSWNAASDLPSTPWDRRTTLHITRFLTHK